MLKGHPKGLIVFFFANMGERFGYYTMIAIFVLFLQAKYGFTYAEASQYYGTFLAAVYFLPLLGGLIADRWLGYGKTVSLGLIIMFLGYLLLAWPTAVDIDSMTTGLPLIVGGLAVISLGTGLFKGNLQALVGNLYDDPKYSQNRDVAFNIFYMGINVGAMFAPTAAEEVSNWILGKYGFTYSPDIPALAHKFLAGDASVTQRLADFAAQQGANVADLQAFSYSYINALAESYHWAFGLACISLVISMLVFWAFRKHYKEADMTEAQKAASADHKDKVIELTPEQTKQRFIALGLVFFVVIFFWMAFHQNGAAMTAFARDYTQDAIGKFTNIFFDLWGLLSIFIAVIGLIMFFKTKDSKYKIISAVTVVVFAVIAYIRIDGYSDVNSFSPQKFQHFNPFFIVALTPVIVGLFSMLRRNGKEPSAPKKIGIGMLITALAFGIMIFGSLSLTGMGPGEIGEQRVAADFLVSPYWLIATYFTLTVAELFLSPMGISFVSKVAPPKYKGLMQGGWFAATAIGNYAIALVAYFWDVLPLWGFWAILVVCCLLSAGFIFAVLKRLERAASS
jgi:proton-dependent oligopeptide transporter, POT family